mgnify:FL=1|jgi:hypothetical protein
MSKLTKKNIYDALINFANSGAMECTIGEEKHTITSEELFNFATNEKAQLEKKNVAARKRAADKAAADELLNAVASVLTDEFQTIAEVTDCIDGADVTTAKIQYRLNSLVKAGEAEKQEMKVTGADGKKRIVMGYRLSDKPANEAIDK